MSETLNDRLKADDFDLVDCVENQELPRKLTAIMFDIMSGKYDDIRIIPGDVALEGERFIPALPCHFIYAKLSDEYRTEEESVACVMVMCKDVKTGEYLHQMPFIRSCSKKEG